MRVGVRVGVRVALTLTLLRRVPAALPEAGVRVPRHLVRVKGER